MNKPQSPSTKTLHQASFNPENDDSSFSQSPDQQIPRSEMIEHCQVKSQQYGKVQLTDRILDGREQIDSEMHVGELMSRDATSHQDSYQPDTEAFDTNPNLEENFADFEEILPQQADDDEHVEIFNGQYKEQTENQNDDAQKYQQQQQGEGCSPAYTNIFDSFQATSNENSSDTFSQSGQKNKQQGDNQSDSDENRQRDFIEGLDEYKEQPKFDRTQVQLQEEQQQLETENPRDFEECILSDIGKQVFAFCKTKKASPKNNGIFYSNDQLVKKIIRRLIRIHMNKFSQIFLKGQPKRFLPKIEQAQIMAKQYLLWNGIEVPDNYQLSQYFMHILFPVRIFRKLYFPGNKKMKKIEFRQRGSIKKALDFFIEDAEYDLILNDFRDVLNDVRRDNQFDEKIRNSIGVYQTNFENKLAIKRTKKRDLY